MPSTNLENLVRTRDLKPDLSSEEERLKLFRDGLARLADARKPDLSFISRFDLAYNAAYALASYALRRMGYRSENRYIVFQLLGETAGLEASQWRVLAKAHENRNKAVYEGELEPDERLLEDMISITDSLADKLNIKME